MNRKESLSSAIICILLASSIIFVSQANFGEGEQQKPFLVGVTYGGNNVQDAKTLIDKVSNYTNLFVLNSGPLIKNDQAINEIGDYAVTKGLHFAATTSYNVVYATWISTAEQRWGSMFAGVYYDDEPAGKFLDGTTICLNYENSSSIIVKNEDGRVSYNEPNTGFSVDVYPNGTIIKMRSNSIDTSITDPNNSSITIWNTVTTADTIVYDPNGSMTIKEIISNSTGKNFIQKAQDSNSTDENGMNHIIWPIPIGENSFEILHNDFYTMENGSKRIAQEETYQQTMSKNPISDCNGAANVFTNQTKAKLANSKLQLNMSQGSFPIFTADYGLYWWDYQSGYDMVLAELGWNNTVAQEIALVRGAANLQGKDWGTILTWKYTQAPYLADGDEIFNQMKTSYENGAQYVILFNYAADAIGPYGTLQEQHFQALERFWNEVVQNPKVIQGGIKAEATLVLPCNYGWGMRNPSDVIWGIWEPNATSSQIWTQLQNRLEQYGTKLDIVYQDQAHPVEGKYADVYYWDDT